MPRWRTRGQTPDERPEQLRQQRSHAQECLRSRDEPGTSPDLSTAYWPPSGSSTSCRLVLERGSSTTTSVLAKIIGGWQLSGILRYTSGSTLGVSATQANPVYRGGATAEGIGGSTAIPQTADIVSGVPMKLDTKDFDPRTDRYLNIAAFAQPTGAFGSSMPTIDGLRGFASLNEDLALSKTIESAGPLNASDPRGDVQRVQSCGIREPGEQHRQPGNIRKNHEPGQYASKHADCVEGDILMRAGILDILFVGAAVASATIGFAQAPPGNPGGGPAGRGSAVQPTNVPARGSASVRVPAWRQLRTAVGSLLGWQVGVPLGSFRQDTFLEAARKAEALDLAVVEGDSTQKVSVQIPKNLDYRLAPGRTGRRSGTDDDAELADAGVCHG